MKNTAKNGARNEETTMTINPHLLETGVVTAVEKRHPAHQVYPTYTAVIATDSGRTIRCSPWVSVPGGLGDMLIEVGTPVTVRYCDDQNKIIGVNVRGV